MVDEMIGTNEQNVQAMIHRGGAKSTVLSNYLPIDIAVRGKLENFGVVHNLVIFSATIDQAIEQLKAVRDIWDNSDILQEELKLARDKQGKIVADKVDYLALTNRAGHTLHIQAKGSGQSMRGTKKNGFRPQVCIFDDILKDEILTSENERKKLRTWFYSTVANAVDVTHYKKIVVGTPMTDDDLLMSMSRSKTYKTVKFPVADKFPCKVQDMVTSWPDRFTPERVMKQFNEAKEMGAEADFYREMMLEVVNEDLRIFKEEYFKEYYYKDMKKFFPDMNFFTSIDAAVSKKQSGDYSVVITVGVNSDGHLFIVRCDVGKMNPDELIDTLFEHVKEYRPIETRAEEAALQLVLDHYIEKRMMKTNTFFNYDKLIKNTSTAKEYRILGLQPMMKQGKIHFPADRSEDGIAELMYEMKGYISTGATTAHDDAVDCLANFLDPNFLQEPTMNSDNMPTEVMDGIEDLLGDSLDDYYE
jgi:predicted phage terminase large subunit-like protein